MEPEFLETDTLARIESNCLFSLGSSSSIIKKERVSRQSNVF